MEQLRLCELLSLLVLIAGGVTSIQALDGTSNGNITTTSPPQPTTECDPLATCCPCQPENCTLSTQTCSSGFSWKTCNNGKGYTCEKEGLPVLLITVIAVICGLIVLILIGLLIWVCVRHQKQKLNDPNNVKPIKCTPRQSGEQALEVGVPTEDDTYLIVLPDEDLPCSTNHGMTPPTTDTIYVNVNKGGTSPRLPAKTPPARLKFNYNEDVPKSSEEEVTTDSIYVNVPNEMSNGVSPRTSKHPEPPQDDDDDDVDDDEADSDEDAYDYPGAPYAKPRKEAKAKATSPKKLENDQQTHSLQRGRAPAVPSGDQDIYSPVYEERNLARGVNFPSSPKLGSPGSPKFTTDHIYGNVPFSKGSRSPSAPDMQNILKQRLSPPGYLPMAGSVGRLTSFQYSRDAEDDELYVNDPQIYVNANPNSGH